MVWRGTGTEARPTPVWREFGDGVELPGVVVSEVASKVEGEVEAPLSLPQPNGDAAERSPGATTRRAGRHARRPESVADALLGTHTSCLSRHGYGLGAHADVSRRADLNNRAEHSSGADGARG